MTILHYVGCDHDRGGVISVIRNLAATGRFDCVLGTNPGCVQSRQPALPVLELPRIEAERISPATFWRARAVARAVQAWLRGAPDRVYHGHSRAGLLVALWLTWWGERRVRVSVHCYGRQRWFYRWASGQLNGRLYWLSPAMKKYYGTGDATWTHCVPGCVGPNAKPGARNNPSDGVLRLAGVGALVRWKRWDLVVAALAQLPAAARERVSFRHIGMPENDADSVAFAAELRAATPAGVVEWLGQQDSPAPLLAASDGLVIASENEPFSIAMLEALQAGVPVLAADSGGAPDIIKPGVNGWLFRSGDATDLARCIEALRAAPCVVADFDAARFSSEAVAAQWQEIYAEP
jgi:glycosyltransferase involved in cell wall biosynthesis